MSTVVEHVLAAPSRYVQGRNVIQKLGSHLEPLGSTPLLVADDVVWEIVEGQLADGFQEVGLPVKRVGFVKFATAEAVDSLVETIREAGMTSSPASAADPPSMPSKPPATWRGSAGPASRRRPPPTPRPPRSR